MRMPAALAVRVKMAALLRVASAVLRMLVMAMLVPLALVPMPAAAMRMLLAVMMMAVLMPLAVAAAFAMSMFAAVRMAMPVFVLLIVAMAVGKVVVAVLLLPADAHLHMRPPNAALLRRNCRNLQARNAQRVHIPQKLLPSLRLQQLVERGHEHIPRRAHIAL